VYNFVKEEEEAEKRANAGKGNNEK